MKSLPVFHYHLKEKGIVRPTFTHQELAPLGGIFQTKCPRCGNWGFVFSQRDLHGTGYRIIGQGHTRGSRALNQLPIWGVLLLKTKSGQFLYDSNDSYLKELYARGDGLLRHTTMYSSYAVVPIWREDNRIISTINKKTEDARLKAYAEALAPLYVGVTARDFQLRLDDHLAFLVQGFTSPVATIPRINLAGDLL